MFVEMNSFCIWLTSGYPLRSWTLRPENCCHKRSWETFGAHPSTQVSINLMEWAYAEEMILRLSSIPWSLSWGSSFIRSPLTRIKCRQIWTCSDFFNRSRTPSSSRVKRSYCRSKKSRETWMKNWWRPIYLLDSQSFSKSWRLSTITINPIMISSLRSWRKLASKCLSSQRAKQPFNN